MKKQNDMKGRFLLRLGNGIAIVWSVGTLPGYYFFENHIMRPVFLSCAIYLLLCLSQFFLFKSGKLLITVFVIFCLHVLSYA